MVFIVQIGNIYVKFIFLPVKCCKLSKSGIWNSLLQHSTTEPNVKTLHVIQNGAK